MAMSLRGGDIIAGDCSFEGVVMMSPELADSMEDSWVMGVLAVVRYVAACGPSEGRRSDCEFFVPSVHVPV